MYEPFYIEYEPEYDVFSFEDIVYLKCGGAEAIPSFFLKQKKKRIFFVEHSKRASIFPCK